MDPRDLILIGVRWLHAAGAVALVGGSAFCLLAHVPAPSAPSDPQPPTPNPQPPPSDDPLRMRAYTVFKELVDLSLVVFVISGAILTFDRLSSGAASTGYVIVLGLKIFLSAPLYRWAYQVSRGRRSWAGAESRLLVGSGFLIVFLAAVLKSIYESNLRA